MKIAFAIGELDFKSGIVKVVFNIARELRERFNHDVFLITTGIRTNEDKKRVLNDGLKIIDLDIEKYGHRFKYFCYQRAIRKNIENENINVIIVAGTEHVLFYASGVSTMKLKSPKLFVWEHRNFRAGPMFRLEWLGKRYAIKNWDGVICITKKDANQYLKHTDNIDKIYQIYNLTNFISKEKIYDSKSKKIISCGSLSYIKGFDMLIDIAKIVFNTHSDWTWDIYGEGPERKYLERLIKESNLENHVFLKGYSNNINDLYNQYAFLVSTSRTEGMGMVIVEAQKSGLPTISFDIECGPSDVITDGVNGFLVKPFEIKEMADKICCLIEDKEKRKALSCKAEMNLVEFEKEYIVNKWMQLLG